MAGAYGACRKIPLEHRDQRGPNMVNVILPPSVSAYLPLSRGALFLRKDFPASEKRRSGDEGMPDRPVAWLSKYDDLT